MTDFTPARPIQPGCMALATSTNHPCCVVTVIRFTGSIPGYQKSDLWEVDKLMPWSQFGCPIQEPYWPECSLTRLDDPDIQKQIESDTPVEVECG